MSLFERLKGDSGNLWTEYIRHEFVEGLRTGKLNHECFKFYLKQDYLFLSHFSRAYALAIYKSRDLTEMRENLNSLSAILETEMDLHVRLCEGWGISKRELETEVEAAQTIAYTRFVLEEGLRGDLLDLKVALSPCVIGYGEIGRYLISLPNRSSTGDYNSWIEEYGGIEYQQLAENAKRSLDSLGDAMLTEMRYPKLLGIFKQATMLERDFWQMALDAV